MARVAVNREWQAPTPVIINAHTIYTMKINAIIVEDEEKGAALLKGLLEKYCIGVNVSGIARNKEQALALLGTQTPDVVFLDIELNGRNSFELLEKIPEIRFHIIFVTAFQKYALKAIRFSALDYLLKPIMISELQAAVDKLKNALTRSSAVQYQLLHDNFSAINPFKKIVLFALDGYYPVAIEDILFCMADNSYTHFYMAGGKHHIVSRQLKEYDALLSGSNFFRIHKSYLINLNHMDKVSREDGMTVIMADGGQLPVSLRKREEFIEKLRFFNGGQG